MSPSRPSEELGARGDVALLLLASKDDLLDGIADAVVAEINDVVGTIDVPSAGASWKTAARRRILSAREVKLRILGCDMAGQVEAVGPDVTEVRSGDDVFALLAQGGFAEYVSVPETPAAWSRQAVTRGPEPSFRCAA